MTLGGKDDENVSHGKPRGTDPADASECPSEAADGVQCTELDQRANFPLVSIGDLAGHELLVRISSQMNPS